MDPLASALADLRTSATEPEGPGFLGTLKDMGRQAVGGLAKGGNALLQNVATATGADEYQEGLRESPVFNSMAQAEAPTGRLRREREQIDEWTGDPETTAGTVAGVGSRLAFEGASAVAAGNKLAPAMNGASLAARAARNLAAGAPIDLVQAATPETSLTSVLSEYTDLPFVDEMAESRLGRSVGDVALGATVGTALEEALRAGGRGVRSLTDIGSEVDAGLRDLGPNDLPLPDRPAAEAAEYPRPTSIAKRLRTPALPPGPPPREADPFVAGTDGVRPPLGRQKALPPGRDPRITEGDRTYIPARPASDDLDFLFPRGEGDFFEGLGAPAPTPRDAGPVRTPEQEDVSFTAPANRGKVFQGALAKARELDDRSLEDAYKERLRVAARTGADEVGRAGTYFRANARSADARLDAYGQALDARGLERPSNTDAWRDVSEKEAAERFTVGQAIDEARALDDDGLLDKLDEATTAFHASPGDRGAMERMYSLAGQAKDRGLIGGSMFGDEYGGASPEIVGGLTRTAAGAGVGGAIDASEGDDSPIEGILAGAGVGAASVRGGDKLWDKLVGVKNSTADWTWKKNEKLGQFFFTGATLPEKYRSARDLLDRQRSEARMVATELNDRVKGYPEAMQKLLSDLADEGADAADIERRIAQAGFAGGEDAAKTVTEVHELFKGLGEEMHRLGMLGRESMEKYGGRYLPRYYRAAEDAAGEASPFVAPREGKVRLDEEAMGRTMRRSEKVSPEMEARRIDHFQHRAVTGALQEGELTAAEGFFQAVKGMDGVVDAGYRDTAERLKQLKALRRGLRDQETEAGALARGATDARVKANTEGRFAGGVAKANRDELAGVAEENRSTFSGKAQGIREEKAKLNEEIVELQEQIGGYEREAAKKGFVKLSDDKRLGSLSGMWVRKDVADDLNGLARPAHLYGSLIDGYDRALRAWKKMKCLALDTPIPTPAGWTTMGEVEPGDTLFDEHGQPCVVHFVTPIQYDRECFRVTLSDGTSLVADAEHPWYTLYQGSPGVRSTVEIRDTLLERTRGDRNHSIPVAGPLQIPDADLPLSPYVLGVWLGDGVSRQAQVVAGAEDAEETMRLLSAEDGVECRNARPDKRTGVVTFLLQAPETGTCRRGHPVEENRTPKGCRACANEVRRAKYHGQPRPPRTVHSIRSHLVSLGVLENKHIPAAYLRGSEAQRMALLQGLMDSDGTVGPDGRCSFSTTTAALRDGFMELARSLGYKPQARTQRATVNGKDCGDAFSIAFHATEDRPVFRLARKRENLKPAAKRRARSSTRQIVAVEPVDSVPVRCIRVSSPSSLFLAGEGMIVTHNTVYNPATHGRNVVGSQILSWMGGGPTPFSPTYFEAIGALRKGEGKWFNEARQMGLLDTSYVKEEIESGVYEHGVAAGADAATTAARAADVMGAGKGRLKKVDEKLSSLYHHEDLASRLSHYIHQRKAGKSTKEAAEAAAKWVPTFRHMSNATRAWSRVVPFFAYTAAALPLVAEASIRNPVRFLTAGAASYALGKELFEEDVPEKVLPPQMQGPLGAPDEDDSAPVRMAKRAVNFATPTFIPFAEGEEGRRSYLDFTYIMPWGDIAENRSGEYGPMSWLPGQANPLSNPVMGTLASLGLNKDRLTGREITRPSMTGGEKAGAVADYVYKQAMPSLAPEIPGTGVEGGWGYAKLKDAFTSTPNWYGEVRSPGSALADAVLGMKQRQIVPRREYRSRVMDVREEAEDLRSRLRDVLRDPGIPQERKEAFRLQTLEQMRELQEKMAEFRDLRADVPGL